MIKGRYVAQIEIDFSYIRLSENQYEMAHAKLYSGWMEEAIEHHLNEIFYSANPQIKVTRQLADICKEGDEDASD
ncbi:hypothetical protein [uncultured Methanobrevibacter sp.]|uniref:hypothetical protein n=1 Tax=uncultured Methanobrevibacter sp. TaxID=253161 RepID=UPI00263180E2|nr:hypothetical protein [uncultured Methanobrevibacter sp.]